MILRRLFLISCFVLLKSCSPADMLIRDDVILNTTMPAGKVTEEDPEVEIGETAIVETVMAVYPSTWPDEIELVISGYFPDGCTVLSDVLQSKRDKKLFIQVITSRPVNTDCTMALEPFTISVPMSLTGLEEGYYQKLWHE